MPALMDFPFGAFLKERRVLGFMQVDLGRSVSEPGLNDYVPRWEQEKAGNVAALRFC